MKRISEYGALKACLITAGICFLAIVIVEVLRPLLMLYIPGSIFIPLHVVLEGSSIVISYAIFTVGWYAYKRTQHPRDLFIAIAFLTIGAIDFIHTLSYRGMPNFIGTNTVGKAAGYWLVARFVEATALFIAAFMTINRRSKWLRPSVMVSVSLIIVIGSTAIITEYGQSVSNLLFTPEKGLTPFKIALEWVIIGIYVAALFAVGRVGNWLKDSTRFFQMALVVAIASEICFTLYNNAFGSMNMLGHILKIASFYLVLQALMVSSLGRPYDELSRAKDRLQKSFDQIGNALSSGLKKNETLKLIATLAQQIFETDVAMIGEVRADETIDVATVAGLSIERYRIPVKESIVNEAIETHSPILISDVFTHIENRPEFIRQGLRSVMIAPIVADSRLHGAIYVGSRQANAFTDEDTRVLTSFAGQAAIAITNAEHYEREHRIADALQQSVFPPNRMQMADFVIAGKYQAAWDEAKVGGDFYDYFDLGGSKLGIVIGDVSGKGLDAAVHTALSIYSIQAYLHEGYTPAEAITRLQHVITDRKHRRLVPDSLFLTLFCGILDTNTGQLVYVNAGHEPPIIMDREGNISDLNSTGPLVGLQVDIPFEQAEVELNPGDTLVLYTDGITESRWAGEFFGYEGIAEAIRSCRECEPDEITDQIYERAKSHARGLLQDDIAVVVIKCLPDDLFDLDYI